MSTSDDHTLPVVSPEKEREEMARAPSNSRRLSLSDQISVIRGRIGRVLSHDAESVTSTLVDAPATPSIEQSRSVSRGRDTFQSSGRGGVGNIRRSSVSREPASPEDEFAPVRGREPVVNPSRIVSTGRGGAGNIRSASKGAHDAEAHPQTASILSEHATSTAQYEREIIKKNDDAKRARSTGRGGLGNIKKSRSRSKDAQSRSDSRGPLHSTGRGGIGNIKHGEGGEHDFEDEIRERLEHSHADGLHSTGRGGAANITPISAPAVEHLRHQEGAFESSGRGGAGNIRSRSGSRDPSVRNQSSDKRGISGFLHKVTHPHHGAPEEGTPAEQE